MDWDVVVLKLTTDNGYQGNRNSPGSAVGPGDGSYLHDNIAPVVLGASLMTGKNIGMSCGTLTGT